ncbi:MAG: hypothetical protein WB565_15040 [Acidimicrobiales bacterium]
MPDSDVASYNPLAWHDFWRNRLAADEAEGLDWVLADILLAFVSASINAWVLLVEIKR